MTYFKKSSSSLTTYGFYIRKGDYKAAEDVTNFMKHEKGQLSYEDLKKAFMINNDIPELNDDDFVGWMRSIGWFARIPLNTGEEN